MACPHLRWTAAAPESWIIRGLAAGVSLILIAAAFPALAHAVQGSVRRDWERRKAFIILNFAFYGLIAAAMVVAAFNPAIQNNLLNAVRRSFKGTTFPASWTHIKNGHLPAAISFTFLVNLAGGAFASITLPSLALPFLGILIGLWRASMWGLILSPTNGKLAMIMIPHSLTLVVEGQAYVVAMFAAYLHGRALLWPQSVGAPTHWKGYLAGLKRTAHIYPLIVALLGIAAVYEALEVIYIVPLLM